MRSAYRHYHSTLGVDQRVVCKGVQHAAHSGNCSTSFLAPVTPTNRLVGVTSQPYILFVGGWGANN